MLGFCGCMSYDWFPLCSLITYNPKVMSVLSSLKYCSSNSPSQTQLWLAFTFMPLGLFFDFFDGKVARWRKKSSLMGQELDSLADLVWKNESFVAGMLTKTGVFRSCSCDGGFRNRVPNIHGSNVTQLLCALWTNEIGKIQRYSCYVTERQDWKVAVLRGNTGAVCMSYIDRCHGYMYLPGQHSRQNTSGIDTRRHSFRLPSSGTDVCSQRLSDG